jgi:hypothetical protein
VIVRDINLLVYAYNRAALAIEHQSESCSNDADFARFPGLRGRNPLKKSQKILTTPRWQVRGRCSLPQEARFTPGVDAATDVRASIRTRAAF